MKWLSGIVLISLVVLAFGSRSAVDGETLPPILSLDLSSLGYVWPAAERDVHVYDFLRYAVAFVDEQTLGVSFMKRNEHPGMSRRDGTAGSMFLFHTVLLNPITGQINGQRSWGNAGNWNTFLPLGDGQFFVQDDEWIRLCTKDFREIAAKRVAVHGDLLPRFLASPSGRTLYEFHDGYDHRHGWFTMIETLDPSTLAADDTAMVTSLHSDETVSDTELVYSFPRFKDVLRLFAYKRNDAAPAKPTLVLEKDSPTANTVAKSHCQSATLINDSVLAITGACSKVILLRGREEYDEVEFLEYRVGGEVRPSSDGQRLAFARFPKEDPPSKITRLELCVYDLNSRRLVFTESVSPLPQRKFAFALSADGSLLAAQSDNLLRVWRLTSRH